MTITSDDIYDLIRQGENISVEMKESVSPYSEWTILT